MKNKIYVLFFLILFKALPVSSASIELSQLNDVLLRLDSLIEVKPKIHALHELKLDSLKRLAANTDDSWQKYMLYGSLFYEYLHYQADSSYYYVSKKEEMLPLFDMPHLKNEVLINRAEVFRVMGLRMETEILLKDVDKKNMDNGMLQYYYSVCCSHYTNMAEYVPQKYGGTKYSEIAGCYRDSILSLLPEGVNHDLVFSEQLLQRDELDKVVLRLETLLDKSYDDKSKTYLHYTLSEAYKLKNDTVSMMYHLAKTAISDIKHSVREYAALQKLAWSLYNTGDMERAYKYAQCSVEDATACYAQLRSMESGSFQTIIQNEINEKTIKAQKATRYFIMVGTVLFILLLIMLIGLAFWTKKISQMKTELANMNLMLENSNKELSMTGKIKETYIAHYLDKCVNYIESLEQYRRSLEKLAMSSKIDELFKAIKKTSFLDEQRKNFYTEFDRSFLELFPDFIDRFNDLLMEGEKVTVKSSELLTTELRIFALIRLGITDSSRIAHFLGYSLTTIYNYRSKFRNKAKGNKDTFEQRVMELCI